jgi:hypothetical protein
MWAIPISLLIIAKDEKFGFYHINIPNDFHSSCNPIKTLPLLACKNGDHAVF